MYDLGVLGSPRLVGPDGNEIRTVLSQPKRLALLSYLAATSTDAYVRRDKLVGLLWAESTEQRARASLSEALSQLRRSLDPAVITTRGEQEVGVDASQLRCDAVEFLRAVDAEDWPRAVEVYGGPLLDGFFLDGCPEFDTWLEHTRAHLTRTAVDALGRLTEKAMAAGDHSARALAERAYELDPLDGGAVRRLMRVLVRAGQRDAALGVYDTYAARLREERGIEPSPETVVVVQRVREGRLGVGSGAGRHLEAQDLSPTGEDPKPPRATSKAITRVNAALEGRYRIERELDEGGTATVYLADDLRHERRVALKVLKPELTSAVGPERFLREVTVTAGFDHPHIVPLLDSGEADGLLFYVMPYVVGESLRERLDRERQLSLEDALRIAQEVADALGYAHGLGVIHRDIKPGNILLSGGHARVTDFGVARAVTAAGDEELTQMGMAIGTPKYMSPEQASGDEAVDTRSDLYSLGCVVYEMLAGDPPFTASTPQAVLARKAVEPPPPLSSVRDAVPEALEKAILKALARLPAGRFTTVADFADALAEGQEQPETSALTGRRPAHQLWSATLRHRWAVVAMVTGTIVAIVGGARIWEHQAGVRWARNAALPEAVARIAQGETYAAFRLLRQAEAYVPDDAVLQELLLESTAPVNVRTTPAGALVYIREFLNESDAWERLGSAPLEGVRVPIGNVVWKISLEGFETMLRVDLTLASTYHFSLYPADETPRQMVHVPSGVYAHVFFGEAGFELEDSWIDTYEVTNRDFKAFVDRGGYEDREYWTEPIVRKGVVVSWEESRQLFRDRTGRPGPAMWEVGTYPDGRDDYPVDGISWYEAAAYCSYVGKQLPTLYHWYQAADAGFLMQFAEFSQFAADDAAEVGHPLRLGAHGTYDMAGNVKEWVWNEADAARRYILGGGWNAPSYQGYLPDAQPALDREPTFGVRCAEYPTPLPAAETAAIPAPFRDWRLETPVGEDMFAVYRSQYEYDPSPLEPSVDPEREEFEHWSVERVEFAAAYGDERVPAQLFLPRDADPPYQTVVYFPGVDPWWPESSPGEFSGQNAYWFLFLVRSGRAVLLPVYKGMWDRYAGQIHYPHVWRDVFVDAAKDLRRAVDYLETRTDIDVDRLAYFGQSNGATVGPIMTAVEPRFKASVWLSGGLMSWEPRPPESDPFNFLPRVTAPTLVINGRHDFFFPYETSQVPMFEHLGLPQADKEHLVFESGHLITARQEVMGAVLDWLDDYLGPVPRR